MLHSIPQTEDQFSKDPEGLKALLAYGATHEHFCRHWLSTQCASIANVKLGVLILKGQEDGVFRSIAKWPSNAKVGNLSELAEGSLKEQKTLVTKVDDPDGEKFGLSTYALALPVYINGQIAGVLALGLKISEQVNIRPLITQLEWAAGWLELYQNRSALTVTDATAVRLQAGVKLLAKIHACQSFAEATMTLVTELAAHFKCDRVSFGVPKNTNKVEVKALSHSAQFGKRQNLISSISHAMREAMLLGNDIHHLLGELEKDDVASDHHLLANEYNTQTILTLPIYAGEAYLCIVSLEREELCAFTQMEIDYCRSILALLAPAIEDKRLNDRNIFIKCKDALGEQLWRFISPKYIGRKLFAASVLLLVLFFSFATGDFKVTADTRIEGAVQRVIVAPYNGYISTADFRAGDIIQAGTVIGELDDRDLRMERLKFMSERSQYQKQYQNAMAKHERAEANVVKAQLAQATANFELVETQLERAVIRAPFDAIIINGDLSQRLGASVQQGEELFVLAPLDNYRIILDIDERRIAYLEKGQSGKLVLSSFPDQTFDFKVTTITPITEAKDGNNVFRVEAELVSGAQKLRPGMEGIGKVIVGEDKLFTIWTRGFVEWIQLWAWKWLP